MGRLSKLARYLNEHVVGNVFDNAEILELYKNDRSILTQNPRLVAFPETTDDVRKLVRFSHQLASRNFRLPITVRGAGLDKTGAAIGDGLIMSTAKLNHFEEIDLRGRLIRVQPGLTLGRLNAALRFTGLELPVRANPRSTIGGLIANCSSDPLSDHYGGIYHFVERMEVVLSNGELAQLAPYNAHGLNIKQGLTNFEGEIYRKIDNLWDKYGDIIVDRSMQPFDLRGYANITKVRQGHVFNLLPLFFASQGTLGIMTDVILRLEPTPTNTRRLAVSFHDLRQAQRFLTFARDLDPLALDIYDLSIIEQANQFGNKPDLFRRKIGQGLLVIAEFDGWRFRSQRKINHCLEFLPSGIYSVVETPENRQSFAEVDRALASYLNDDLSGERTPLCDDVYIPEVKLEDFLRELKKLGTELDTKLAVFGSFSAANYHVRPDFRCETAEDRQKVAKFLRTYTALVEKLGGSITGGTPEGRLKSILAVPHPVGEQALYQEVKDIFDPYNILNPGVKLGAERKKVLQSFRSAPLLGVCEAD